MQKKLNAKKVVEEIDLLIDKLNNRLKEKGDFEDLHKKTLQLCENIFDAKKSYRDIQVSYPISLVIVFKDFSGKKNRADKKLHVPDKKQQWKQKEDLLIKSINVLREARELYALRVRLLE